MWEVRVGNAVSRMTRDTGGRRGPGTLAFVGRDAELQTLREHLTRARAGEGAFVLVVGETGVGKTRLVQQLAEEARKAGCLHAAGHAYEVEAGHPYAIIADAFVPVVQGMDAQTLTLITRGTDSELAQILPSLARTRPAASTSDDPDTKTRMLWHFAQFLQRLAARKPVVLTLDNLQWADAASLELLHYIARHLSNSSLLVIATCTEEGMEDAPAVRKLTRSLQRHRGVRRLAIPPLEPAEVTRLVRETFGATGTAVAVFATRLFDQTRGNPFFIEEILKALIERGALKESGGHWSGWDADVTQLPATVRDAVRFRLESLSPVVARIAGLMAAVGTPVSLRLLQRMVGDPAQMGDPLHELVRRSIIVELTDTGEVAYGFVHPMVRGIIYSDLGAARARSYHGEVIQALEAIYGDDSLRHATEFAPHLAMAAEYVRPVQAIHYLLAAGRDALGRHADRAADRFLSQALELIERTATDEFSGVLSGVLVMLARVRHRNGAWESARDLLLHARELARQHDDTATEAAIERRLGLATMISGRPEESLPHFDAAENISRRFGIDDLLIRTRVARATALQALGRWDDALRTNLEVFPVAEALGDPGLLARLHRELVLLYGWRGPASEARRHGEAVQRYAKASGDASVEWSAHWAMAILAGFTGDSKGVLHHQQEAERIAHTLHSPMLIVLTAEVGIEYASGVGAWAEGLASADRVLPIARAIAPRTVLPRLLVWTGLMLLERDEEERAEAHFREAWALADVEQRTAQSDLSVMVPACTGMAAFHLSRKEYHAAVGYASRGLEITDHHGYIAWAIHRLLPILCEAQIWLENFREVDAIVARLRRESTLLDHQLGMAWADAGAALVMRFRDNLPEAAARIMAAADRLEAVPFRFHAARMRRNAGQVLALDGRRDQAVEQVRRAHDLLLAMGAERELRGAREQLRDLGVRPPQKTMVAGGALSGREREIAELVARRKSNKEIAQALQISVRTVSTHLSNIFLKLNVESRGELADHVRGITTQ